MPSRPNSRSYMETSTQTSACQVDWTALVWQQQRSHSDSLETSCRSTSLEIYLIATRWYFMGCQWKHPLHISLCSMLFSHRIMLSGVGYTNLTDTELHSAMRLISGCLQPTHLSCLPVLSNVAPTSLCCWAAKFWQYVSNHQSSSKLLMYADVFEHPHPQLASRCPI